MPCSSGTSVAFPRLYCIGHSQVTLLKSLVYMEISERQYREDIIRVCRLVYEKGWVAMNDGNISIRLDERRILCTPTAISKGFVNADELIICDNGGDKLEGTRERTSEIAMHTTIYGL